MLCCRSLGKEPTPLEVNNLSRALVSKLHLGTHRPPKMSFKPHARLRGYRSRQCTCRGKSVPKFNLGTRS